MPSKSKAQHNLMEAVAHSPAFAKKVGIKQSVGKDFAAADKGKKFKEGGMAHSDKKEDMKMDKAQDKALIKKAVGMHDKQMHGGKKTDMTSLKKGGMCGGGTAKKMAKGGGIEVRGKTRGKMC